MYISTVHHQHRGKAIVLRITHAGMPPLPVRATPRHSRTEPLRHHECIADTSERPLETTPPAPGRLAAVTLPPPSRYLRPQDGLNTPPCRSRARRKHLPRLHVYKHPRRSEGHRPIQADVAPNSRAAPKNERFRRSQPCTGGAGGTRTHGRRIMSPSRILATLVDRCSSWPFSQVRRGLAPQSFSALVSLFRSLCPTCVPNASRKDKPNWARDDRPSSGVGLKPANSGFTFRRRSAPPRPLPGGQSILRP
jgi:hypothetical protein